MSDNSESSDLDIPFGRDSNTSTNDIKNNAGGLFDSEDEIEDDLDNIDDPVPVASDNETSKHDGEEEENHSNTEIDQQSSVKHDFGLDLDESDGLDGDIDKNDSENELSDLNQDTTTDAKGQFMDINDHPQHFLLQEYNTPKDQALSMLKLGSNFGFIHKPFDPVLYDVKEEEEQLKSIYRLNREDCLLRWRWKRNENGEIVYDASGIPQRESNAHIVQWEDGTYHMFVGDSIIGLDIVKEDSQSQCVLIPHKAEDSYVHGRFENMYESHGIIANKILPHTISITHKNYNRNVSTSHTSEGASVLPDYIVPEENKTTAKKPRTKRVNKAIDAEFMEEDLENGDIGAIKRDAKRKKQEAKNKQTRRNSDDYEDEDEESIQYEQEGDDEEEEQAYNYGDDEDDE
ncbi:hypothetical protein WA158_006163 [Blastocystis sp. Blastoise]